jgi:xanthine dehydrogenase YagS FAD-binding subunit
LVRDARIASAVSPRGLGVPEFAEAEPRGEPAAPERFRAAAEAELAAARPLPGSEYKVVLARDLIEAVLTEFADGGA